MISQTKVLSAVTLAALVQAPLAGQQEHEHPSGSHGRVDFQVSCAPEVQGPFNEAVAMLHSFGYEQAHGAFIDVAKRDPACGMAHWGEAMSYYHSLWAPPTPEELAAGRVAAERAVSIGAGTAREKAYVEAVLTFYRDADRLDHRTRAVAYRDAMEQLAREFPDDDEASIFLALAILGAAPPSDSAYAEQKRAAEILSGLLPRHPRHPGIAHYTIHAFDYPELAELALPAARVYADIAQSPHALHMPSHIFTRLGLWDESIAANIDCEQAASLRVERTHPGAASFEALHCEDYLAYAYLQLGDDERARQVVERVSSAERFDEPSFTVGYALPAVPARYALERRDWNAASHLSRPAIELPWHQYEYAHAVTHFANAIGAARTGDTLRARRAVAELEQLHASLAANPAAGPYDWAGQVEATHLAAAGWLAFAEDRHEEAVRLMSLAAEKEEAVGKHPVTPGAILPARELLGDLLLELGRPHDALLAYEAALADAPRRFNAKIGRAHV